MNPSSKKKHYLITLLASASIFCMCMNATGAMISYIMTDYQMNLEHAGLMTLFQYAGGILGILLVSWISDRMNKSILLAVSYMIMGVTLFLVGGVLPFTMFMVVYFLLGIGIGMVDVLNNAVICDLHQENRDVILSILHALCGVGASFIPILTVIVGTGKWNVTYRITSGIVWAVIILQVITYVKGKRQVDACFVPSTQNTKKQNVSRKTFLSDKKVWIATICMLGYGIGQSGNVIWCVNFCKETLPEVGALGWALVLSFYWIGTTASRLLMGVVPALQKWDSRLIIIWGGFLGALCEIAGILSGNHIGMIISFCLMGLLTGVMIPKIVAMITNWYPEMSGLASGISFMAIYTPFALIPLLMGNIGSAFGMVAMMFVPIVGFIVMSIFGMMLPKK